MTRVEAVVSPVPPGAGRFQDWVWPDPWGFVGGLSATYRSRISGTQAIAEDTAIGGGLAGNYNVVDGMACAQMNCDNGGRGESLAFAQGGMMQIMTSLNNLDPTQNDENVKRVVVVMRGIGLAPNAGNDFGFQICRHTGVGSLILLNVGDGIGIQIQDPTFFQLIIRGPNGLVTQNIPADTQVFTSFDIRITDASATAAAKLSILVNNVPLLLPAASSSWAPGTNLPPSSLVNARTGWVATMVAAAGNNNHFFTQQVRLITAPTEAATL